MGNSLQEQLIQAGLASEQRLKETRSEKRKSTKGGKHRGPRQDEATRRAAAAAKAEKLQKDRELERQRREEADRRALEHEMRQLIHAHRVVREGGDVAYNFADGKALKRLHLSKDQHARVCDGRLVVVRQDTFYELVDRQTAERVQARDPGRVLVWNRPDQQPAADDPYAEFEVPDDLMW